MYLHVRYSIGVAFSVYWHDLLLEHSREGPHGPQQRNSTQWIGNYLDLLQYKGWLMHDKPHAINYQFLLLTLIMHIRSYADNCTLYNRPADSLASDSGSLLTAPCGNVYIKSHLPTTPIRYQWTIKVAATLKVNFTIDTLDIAYENLRCIFNHLHIYDNAEPDTSTIAKLCGQSSRKTFYSHENILHVVLSLKYEKYDNELSKYILAYVYQAIGKGSLVTADILPKARLRDKAGIDEQIFLAVTERYQLKVLYYNVQITQRIRLHIELQNCSSAVSVFDGPSSKSQLLGEFQSSEMSKPQVLTSTLFLIAVYMADEINQFKSCVFVNVSAIKAKSMHKYNVEVTNTESKHFSATIRPFRRNEMIWLKLAVPSGKFVNLKIRKFEYTGSTEAGCYLGGFVIIYHVNRVPVGPLCGNNGRVLLEDHRMDGLTLQEREATLIMFMFRQHYSYFILDITIAPDDCHGLRTSVPSSLSKLSGNKFDLLKDPDETNVIRMLIKTPNICIKFQDYFDVLGATESSGVLIYLLDSRGYAIENQIPFKITLRIASRLPVVEKDFYSVALNEKMDRFDPSPFTIISMPQNTSYLEKTFDFVVRFMILTRKRSYAPHLDGAIEVKLVLKEYYCSDETRLNYTIASIDAPQSLTEELCSIGYLTTDYGLYSKILMVGKGYNVLVKASVEVQNNTCPARDLFLYISVTHRVKWYGISYSTQFTWFMDQDLLEVTVEDPTYSLSGYFLIMHVAVNLKQTHTPEQLNYFDYSAEMREALNRKNLPEDALCQYHIQLHHTLTNNRAPQKEASEALPSYCFLTTCYFVYKSLLSSWSSASESCERNNQTLLTINSDIEAQYIHWLVSTDRPLAFSPLVFLNMNQTSKNDHIWLDGSVVSYQKWLHPTRNKTSMLSYDLGTKVYAAAAKHKMLHRYDKQSEQRHFQPQLSEEKRCVADVATEYYDSSRAWVKISCTENFSNVSVICEEAASDDQLKYMRMTNAYQRLVNETAFSAVTAIRKFYGKLVATAEYCEKGWLYFTGECLKLYYESIPEYPMICNALNESHINHVPSRMGHLSREQDKGLRLCRKAPTNNSLHTIGGLFQCTDGTFLVEHHVCDGAEDCTDGSDELHCDHVCTFSIPSTNLSCFTACTSDICNCHMLYFQCDVGGCIPLSKFCDHFKDCEDGSDEKLCENVGDEPKVLNSFNESYECLVGGNISKELVNDTIPDCLIHGDDETWLSDHPISVMPAEDFSSVLLACIPGHPKFFEFEKLCELSWDGSGHMRTCRNGAHLSDCLYHACPHQYKCPWSYCIPLHAVCDGRVDCPAATDEANCPRRLSCPHLLKCKDDDGCVHQYDVNDGVVTCTQSHDDEATKYMPSCPQYCQCLGFAAFCNRIFGNMSSLHYAKALIIRSNPDLRISVPPLHNLNYLDLSHNNLTDHSNPFQGFDSLKVLLLKDVFISVIRSFYFNGLLNLGVLHLQNNSIYKTNSNGFIGLSSLKTLDLSYQMLSTIESCSFQGLFSLLTLNLSYNNIQAITRNTFCGIESILHLDLKGNDLESIDHLTFNLLKSLEVLESSVLGLCCYVSVTKCVPKFEDAFASCTDILAGRPLQIAVWLIAFLAITENVFALASFRIFDAAHSKKKIIHNSNRKNLIVSDMGIGLYFLALAVFHTIYQGDFVRVSQLWRTSYECRVLSFLSLASFQMSLYMVLLLSLERFFAVCLPLKSTLQSVKVSRIITALGWFLSLGIALTPVVTLHYGEENVNNAICSIMISFEKLGMWYTLTVLIWNTTISMSNIIMYASVIYTLRQRQKKMKDMKQQKRDNSGHFEITVRIVCIVATNSACWISIIIMGILLKSGVAITMTMFSLWGAAMLPINALLNPILNVYTTSECRKMISKLFTK